MLSAEPCCAGWTLQGALGRASGAAAPSLAVATGVCVYARGRGSAWGGYRCVCMREGEDLHGGATGVCVCVREGVCMGGLQVCVCMREGGGLHGGATGVCVYAREGVCMRGLQVCGCAWRD